MNYVGDDKCPSRGGGSRRPWQGQVGAGQWINAGWPFQPKKAGGPDSRMKELVRHSFALNLCLITDDYLRVHREAGSMQPMAGPLARSPSVRPVLIQCCEGGTEEPFAGVPSELQWRGYMATSTSPGPPAGQPKHTDKLQTLKQERVERSC